MRRLLPVLLIVLMTLPVAAQQTCAAAATEAADILSNAQTLLDQGNVTGANTLLDIAQQRLRDCVSDTSDAANATAAPPPATMTSAPAATVTPQPLPPTATATSAPVTSNANSGNFTVNAPSIDENQGIAFVYFAHTSVDAGAIDLYMDNDDQPIVSNLSYGEVTDRVWIRSGGRTFTARPAGTGVNGDLLYRLNWNFVSNSTWVVVGAGVREQFAFIVEPISVIRNNYDAKARVRVVNLVAGAPRLTVEDNSGRVFANRLGWVGLQDTLVAEGAYRFTVSTDDQRTVDIPAEINLSRNVTTTLLAIGNGSAQQPVTFLRFDAAREATRVRFINDSASPIEIYMRPDNYLLVEILDPGAQTDYFTLPSGAATFISYAPGTGPTGRELAGLPWQLRPGRDMTISVRPSQMVVQDVSLRLSQK